MTRYDLWLLFSLILCVVGTGIGVAYAKYLSRTEFAELQALQAERDALDVRWEQLRLEEAALATHPRVEAQARELLGMHLPRSAEVRVIDGGADGR
jgi:cell division protein FtsL